jgi:hypothetical protein
MRFGLKLAKMIEITDRWSKAIATVLGISLFFYVAIRAYQLSFTFDESSTVLKYVNQPYGKIFGEAEKATNHILNTALTKVSSSLFPPGELTYRLPNVLAYIPYLIFSGLLIWRFTRFNPPLKLMGFILLNCNPYILDFFSLCRGYGLGLTLTLGTLFFLVKHFETKSLTALFYSLTCCCLGVLSNFSLLNLYLGICAVCFLTLTQNLFRRNAEHRKPTVQHLILITAVSICLFLVIRAPLSELISTNELFFGGNTGIWSDTVRSLIMKSTYFETPTFTTTALAFSTFILLFLPITVGFILVAKKWQAALPPKSRYITALWVVILIGLAAQHYLFGTRFLIERTALFLIPIFMLSFIFVVDDLSTVWHKQARWTLLLPSLIMFSHTVLSANLMHTLDWKYEQGTKDLMRSLAIQNFDHSMYVGVNWPNTETFYFYKSLYRLNWMDVMEYPPYKWNANDETVSTTPYASNLSMAYVGRNDLARFTEPPLKVDEYPNDRIFVWMQPSSYTQTEYFGNWRTGETQELRGDEFLGFISDSLCAYFNLQKPLNLRADVTLHTTEEVEESNVNLVLYIDPNTYKAAQSRSSRGSEGEYIISLYFQTETPVENALFDIYLWNVDKRNLLITDFKLTVFE